MKCFIPWTQVNVNRHEVLGYIATAATASPNTDSSGYIPESDSDEDSGDDDDEDLEIYIVDSLTQVMSSDSHATITYTSMSSYEVIVNGYYGMPMDPLDPYENDVDDEDEEESSDNEEEEEEHLAPTDDANDEDEEESSDSEEEEEEHLTLTVPAPTLHSSISASEDSDQTEPFQEGETAATPPPFGYRVAARISVRPHIPMPFPPKSRTPPIGTPPLLPIPLPTSSFPLPLLLPSTSGSESVLEADMLLRKRAPFTTPTGGYKVGESSVVAAARQIRPALIVVDSRRAEDRLIGRLRRESQSQEVHTSTLVTQIEALQRDVSTLQGQQIDDKDRLTRHIQYEHAQRDDAPKNGHSCS
nr:hypothetical protein [Tanacetum cinerariifolium]